MVAGGGASPRRRSPPVRVTPLCASRQPLRLGVGAGCVRMERAWPGVRPRLAPLPRRGCVTALLLSSPFAAVRAAAGRLRGRRQVHGRQWMCTLQAGGGASARLSTPTKNKMKEKHERAVPTPCSAVSSAPLPPPRAVHGCGFGLRHAACTNVSYVRVHGQVSTDVRSGQRAARLVPHAATVVLRHCTIRAGVGSHGPSRGGA